MLYEISNLVCAYQNGGKKVLHVEKLVIPKGKIIVILGLSGIGKSTLLETLGLMNNTIVSDDQTVFRFNGNDNQGMIELSQVWSEKPDRYISTLRNQHFSFIFQDTNLMPNFSAIENIMLTLMLQGFSKSESRDLGMEYMEKVGMGEIDPDNKVFELSGGQRQRIAFIRAICPEFTVLLGDEPTGNLDRFTSHKLMQVLKASIREKERSAIIVSHNIDLSIEFADQLIIISKKEKQPGTRNEFYGFINQGSVYNLVSAHQQRKWENGKGSHTDLQMFKLLKNMLSDQSNIAE